MAGGWRGCAPDDQRGSAGRGAPATAATSPTRTLAVIEALVRCADDAGLRGYLRSDACRALATFRHRASAAFPVLCRLAGERDRWHAAAPAMMQVDAHDPRVRAAWAALTDDQRWTVDRILAGESAFNASWDDLLPAK